MKKKLTIGRSPECDIQIKDSTEKVSRRHAIITFSPTGKMMLYDTSSNGTFVNGEKVQKPNGMPIQRGDKVDLGHVAELDWDQISDPYKSTRLLFLILFIVLFLGIGAFFVYTLVIADEVTEKEETEQVEESGPAMEPTDSLDVKSTKGKEVAPAVEEITAPSPNEKGGKEEKTAKTVKATPSAKSDSTLSVKKGTKDQPKQEMARPSNGNIHPDAKTPGATEGKKVEIPKMGNQSNSQNSNERKSLLDDMNKK